jgi:hypothetical protein
MDLAQIDGRRIESQLTLRLVKPFGKLIARAAYAQESYILRLSAFVNELIPIGGRLSRTGPNTLH